MLAKIGADTAESERGLPIFGKKNGNDPTASKVFRPQALRETPLGGDVRRQRLLQRGEPTDLFVLSLAQHLVC